MAEAYTAQDWKKINAEFDRDPTAYGLPQRIYGSVVLASFNIRKLGSARKRNADIWKFLAKICRKFDLLAVQEVMEDLSGLKRLRDEMGDEYELTVSDTTGAFPGDKGLRERLAFVYRSAAVRKAEITSDLTYDRTKVFQILADNFDTVKATIEEHKKREEEHAAGERKKKPKLDIPIFISFIRQPFMQSFRLVGHPDTDPYEIMAINAHLLYGDSLAVRKKEFAALMEWIVRREEDSKGEDFPGVVLLGDMNLDFDDPKNDIGDIQKYLEDLSNKKGETVHVTFPFLDPHPDRSEVFRTNARQKQTYDQIGLFYRPTKVPAAIRNREFAMHARGPDYGVVNFVDLFAKAIEGVEFSKLPKSRQKGFYSKFEHSVSDHMPIWVRVPLPD